MGMNLTLTNIDKYLKQYFSTKSYNILYLMCGSTYKDYKTSLFYFLWFFHDLLCIFKIYSHLN